MEEADEDRMKMRSNLWKALGPGILVACAAIGGSHLVWSTRAGAEFGFQLLGLLLLVNLFKFPFFLYGQRYTAATGESLLHGYRRLGKIYVWIFLSINVTTSSINLAGLAFLSAVLFQGFGVGGIGARDLALIFLVICAVVVLIGHYRVLDGVAKLVIISLTISTVMAVLFALGQGSAAAPEFDAESIWTLASIGFLIAFMGWMPAPIDLSVWSSLWIFSREKQTGHFATVRETSIDFYIGYLTTVGLAVLFMALGYLVMYGTGESFSETGAGFSEQLINLYAASIGDWSKPLIRFAAFMCIFSTILTCMDGWPRASAASTLLLLGEGTERLRFFYRIWVGATLGGAVLLLLVLTANLIQLLSFAAVTSFLSSPILAWINFKVMRGANVPAEHRPGILLATVSWAGLLFFALFIAAYVYTLLN